ncbi:MAG: RNA polymerase sigma factor SigZ [Prolixibacteraceae bacterium]|nr:RNA polymerase sigma factor SigZ [Prolixibacteraceae bacterium]
MKQSHTEIIWNRFHLKLLNFIQGKLSDPSTAEDILQDVLIKIQTNLPSLKEETKIQSWIFQIARNAVTDYYRKQKKQINENFPGELEERENPENLMPEVADWLSEFIDDLPEKYRIAIIYSELEGRPQKEMAEELGISYANARARIQRGRKLLKNNLEQCCEFFTDQYGNVLDYRARYQSCNDCK